MKAGHLLFSAVQFVFALLVILLGGFFIGLQHAFHWRTLIAQFFASERVCFSLIGYSILGLGIALLIGFFAMHRGIYYRVRMNGGDLLVDPAVVRSYFSEYWKQQFPEDHLSVEVSISKNQRLEVFVQLPFLPLENQLAILEKAEVELGTLLHKHLGYKRPFDLSVLVK